MDDDQQFCLRWNNHQSTLISVFDTLLENGTLVDCTLAAEGKFLKAHKVVLSACSPYFATLLQEQYDKHPIFILKDVKYQELRAMMDYMYRGEVNISQDQLAALLKAAESLQIKGLSDNRSGAPRTEHHRGLNVPATATTGGSGKLTGGYTLEQTKRARIGPSSMDSQDLSGSREGSSSPSRRRRKVRRRSIENTMAEVHDNSNSSQIQGNQSTLLQQSNANLAGVGGITAAASAMASQIQVSGTALPTGSAGVTPLGANQGTTQQLTTSVTKKTESVKGTSDAMNTDNVQAGAAAGADEQDMEHVESHKQNHKHKSTGAGVGKDGEMIIKPKNEYDDDGNEETVEDLTLDEEDMGMDDLDHNAGTSQGGEGSSQGYAAWQHDRSQDELLLATQEAQQRDPQDAQGSLGVGNAADASANGTVLDQQNQSQSESRIRVRNWLMLADQSILEKSRQDNTAKENLTSTNAATNPLSPVSGTANTGSIGTASATGLPSSATTIAQKRSRPTQLDPNTSTMTRIGSIGRTTIACITPVASDGKTPLNNGNVGVVSAAALAAAGVELDSFDDNMTEVIVKIENSSSYGELEETEIDGTGMELEEGGDSRDVSGIEGSGIGDDIDDENADGQTEEESGGMTQQMDPEAENDMNYELKLSSPMSWALDTVKIENEDFEDMINAEQDNNTEDDDDLLTTAAATTKQAASNSSGNGNDISDHAIHTRSGIVLKSTRHGKRRSNNNSQQLQQQQQQQTLQQQQLLLEQQQHLQHLQLQPNRQAVHIKLPSIPATITSITPKLSNTMISSTSKDDHQQSGGNSSKPVGEFQSSLSDDKRYRILIQNQRMRKESLEHSEDMIYNADIEKPWVCRNCNRNYKWKNSLKCHLKNECGQPPRYYCSKLCGYRTNVHSNLKRHLNTKCRDRIDEDGSSGRQTSTYTIVMDKSD